MRAAHAALLALLAGCVFPDTVTRFSLTLKATDEAGRPAAGALVEVGWWGLRGEGRVGADGLARIDLRHVEGFRPAGFGVAPSWPNWPAGVELSVLAEGRIPHVVRLPHSGFLIHDGSWTGMQTLRLRALPLDTDPEGLAVAALKTVVARERRFRAGSDGRSREGFRYANWYWAGPIDGLLGDDPWHFHRRIAGAAAERTAPASLAGYRIQALRRTREGLPYDPLDDTHRPANALFQEYAFFAWGPQQDWVYAVNEREQIYRKRRDGAVPERLPENPAAEGWEAVPDP